MWLTPNCLRTRFSSVAKARSSSVLSISARWESRKVCHLEKSTPGTKACLVSVSVRPSITSWRTLASKGAGVVVVVAGGGVVGGVCWEKEATWNAARQVIANIRNANRDITLRYKRFRAVNVLFIGS